MRSCSFAVTAVQCDVTRAADTESAEFEMNDAPMKGSRATLTAIGLRFVQRAIPHPALRATPGFAPGGGLFPRTAGEG
jgi:hypothetical protein